MTTFAACGLAFARAGGCNGVPSASAKAQAAQPGARTMDDLFLVINEAGMIESVSPAAAQTFGYAMAELCGLPW